MECPYCGSELESNGNWGYLAQHQSGEVLGETFTCNNSDGFETKEECYEFLKYHVEEILTDADCEKWIKQEFESWEEVTCESSSHSVCGSFYTDKNEELHDGYPC